MILRLTRTTAELVGENAGEWQTLEKLARLGQWTTGPRTDEVRLRQLASELGSSVCRSGSRAGRWSGGGLGSRQVWRGST